MNEESLDITQSGTTVAEIWKLMAEIYDPEIPVLPITDLGIVRDIQLNGSADNPRVSIAITPTYTGCPAMDVIRMNIRMKLLAHGLKNIDVKTVLSPPWTTDWMTAQGKDRLKKFGIAPPNPSHSVCSTELFQEQEAVQCPHCNSYNTKMISRFGSTACKAQYQCNECQEPFDYFKCH